MEKLDTRPERNRTACSPLCDSVVSYQTSVCTYLHVYPVTSHLNPNVALRLKYSASVEGKNAEAVRFIVSELLPLESQESTACSENAKRRLFESRMSSKEPDD